MDTKFYSDVGQQQPGAVASGVLLGSVELRKMRTPTKLPIGTVIEWEETLCRHRGTYRNRKMTIAQIVKYNIQSTDGGWYYWPHLKCEPAIKATLPNAPHEPRGDNP